MRRTALVELHLHLDGSIDLPWGYGVAKRTGVIDPDWTFEQYYTQMYFKDYANMEELFKIFDFPCDVMQTKQDLHDSIYYLAKTLNENGIIYAEVRFASQLHTRKGLTQKEVVEAVCAGAADANRDFPDTLIKVINCFMHRGDSAAFNDKENRESFEASKAFFGKGIVGVDLAGYENNCDLTDYDYLFEMAREAKIPYTIHAAEMGRGYNVLQALQMGAHRIGHGIQCVQNPEWLKAVVDAKVPLEVCVTSNCGDGRNYAKHPIRQLFDAGVIVTSNSDNMMFSRTDLTYEHAMLRRIGFTHEELMQITYNAIDAAFCSDEEKEMLRAKAAKIMNE